MDAKRLTGVKASSLKYDLLTALTVMGLHQSGRYQISLARLTLLITARYNWRLDEFCVGQRDLARMWNVTERTVKREVKCWLDNQLVICKRRGVRGRVGAYRLNYPEIYRLSAPYWIAVGPDFEERMTETHPVQDSKVVAVNFGNRETEIGPVKDILPDQAHIPWRATCQRLRELHPAHYQNWLSALRFVGDDGNTVALTTESAFAAHYVRTHLIGIVLEAVEATLGPGRRISVVVENGACGTDGSIIR